MRDFDEQPLVKGHKDTKICWLGNMQVVNHKGEEIKTFLKPWDIFLLAGKQLNNQSKTGSGINHIFHKHFNEIPKRFHCMENNQLDYQQTIIHFLRFFLHDTRNHLEISVSSERDTRPLLIRSPYGRLVLSEYDSYQQIDKARKYKREVFYHVVTFMANTQKIGNFIGYYKSDVEKLSDNSYNTSNHKELDSFD